VVCHGLHVSVLVFVSVVVCVSVTVSRWGLVDSPAATVHHKPVTPDSNQMSSELFDTTMTKPTTGCSPAWHTATETQSSSTGVSFPTWHSTTLCYLLLSPAATYCVGWDVKSYTLTRSLSSDRTTVLLSASLLSFFFPCVFCQHNNSWAIALNSIFARTIGHVPWQPLEPYWISRL